MKIFKGVQLRWVRICGGTAIVVLSWFGGVVTLAAVWSDIGNRNGPPEGDVNTCDVADDKQKSDREGCRNLGACDGDKEAVGKHVPYHRKPIYNPKSLVDRVRLAQLKV
ncbi:hypothetical protein L6452_26344 [Arctium lappa]|uniref:Uncharacterized protein n=1 Tax=Arctium lappa TaxID=4217 RepID=A0ACB9ADJ4_ARCLA|nr:hypothetical protein L6452_26344 [Arctium lappa]